MGQDASAPASRSCCKPCGQWTLQHSGHRDYNTVKIDGAALPAFTKPNAQKENVKGNHSSDVQPSDTLRDGWESVSNPPCKARKVRSSRDAKEFSGHPTRDAGMCDLMIRLLRDLDGLQSNRPARQEPIPKCNPSSMHQVEFPAAPVTREQQLEEHGRKLMEPVSEQKHMKFEEQQNEEKKEQQNEEEKERERSREMARFELEQQVKDAQMTRERQEWLRKIEEQRCIAAEQAKRDEDQREQKRLELNRAEARQWLQRNGFKEPNQLVRKKLSKIRPLHWAVQMQDAEAVQLLLEQGADPSLVNGKNLTPLQFARQLDKAAPGKSKEPLKPWQTVQQSPIVRVLSECADHSQEQKE